MVIFLPYFIFLMHFPTFFFQIPSMNIFAAIFFILHVLYKRKIKKIVLKIITDERINQHPNRIQINHHFFKLFIINFFY